MLEKDYGVKCEEIGEEFETFNMGLKKAFGIKHYKIQRKIIRILNYRAKTGVYNIRDETEAYLKISKVFLEDSEAEHTESEIQSKLLDYSLHMSRLLEENVKTMEKLQASERLAAIGATAAMVGHDLRNPLQVIASTVYLMKLDLKEIPENETRNSLKESLDILIEQVSYMNKIVSDLQAFVKPVEVHKQKINLKELITSTLAEINITEDIETCLQIEELIVETDPQLLKRVLFNVITNAIQAMPNGGDLNIRTFINEDSQIQIVVEDTGEGIVNDVKPKLFTPLFTTKSRGQGFGLAVCKRVLEAQGGTISFESEVGKGTKFIITLPMHY